MLLQLKGFMGLHALVSLVNEQKSQDRKKKAQANFISEKGITSLLKGDTNKDKRCFPHG